MPPKHRTRLTVTTHARAQGPPRAPVSLRAPVPLRSKGLLRAPWPIWALRPPRTPQDNWTVEGAGGAESVPWKEPYRTHYGTPGR